MSSYLQSGWRTCVAQLKATEQVAKLNIFKNCLRKTSTLVKLSVTFSTQSALQEKRCMQAEQIEKYLKMYNF